MQPREYCETILALFLSLRVTSSRVCRRTARYPNVWREHAMQDGHKKICEYIDRIGRPSSKDTDKRKDPASSIR